MMPKPSPLSPPLSLSRLIAAMGPNAQTATALSMHLGVSKGVLRSRMQRLVKQALVSESRQGRSVAYRVLRPEEQMEIAREDVSRHRLVRIDITLQAAWILKGALENVARVGMGQIEQVTTALRCENFGERPRFTIEQLHDAEVIMNGMKRWLLDSGAGPSQQSAAPHWPDKMRLCWVLNRAVRFRLAWDRRPEGAMGVDFDEPISSEHMPGLMVTSSANAQGLPWVHIEMIAATATIVAMALRVNARLIAGDFDAVIDLARDGWVRNARADLASEASKAMAASFTKQLADVLHIVPGSPLPPECAQSIGIADAIARAVSKPRAKPSHFVDANRVDVEAVVHGVSRGPMPASLSTLPSGHIVQRARGEFRVIGPDQSPDHLRVVSESHSLQTALLIALNVAQGGKGRNWTM